MPQTYESSEKFKSQAAKHMNKIIDSLEEIGKLALTETFSPEDKEKIFKRITKEVNNNKKLFEFKKEENKTFEL